MSIPKEPRQLMINLMYLVLTAMLALNVSAEIINAFFALEKGIQGSSKIVDKSNETVMKALDESVKANPKYAEWKAKAVKAQEIAKAFETEVEGYRSELFTAAGGPHPEHPDRPLKYKDKDVTTRMFVDEGRGSKIETSIKKVRESLLGLLDPSERKNWEDKIPLTVDVPEPEHGQPALSWPVAKFNQMPVAAVMPTFAKMVNDSKISTAQILNYCLDKASGKLEYKPDSYVIAIAPNKAYLISGRDNFEASITMGAYSSTSSNIRMTANGANVPVVKGIATYKGGVESGTGEKTFTATATLTNPATGQSNTVKGDFKYEVGQTSCALSADKMNVFYIGVDNPISIAAAGVNSNKLQVSGSGGGISLTGSGKSRVVRVSAPGEATVTVSAGNEMAPAKFPFRVKRIPDPIACFRPGGESSGLVGSGEMKVQQGVIGDLRNFDFDVKCEIQGFEITYHKKREDPVTSQNVGTRMDSKSQLMLSRAMPGDTYYFDNIKARCPGDAAGRKLNSMVWKIR
jgi:gliding motility-associated protein GldM